MKIQINGYLAKASKEHKPLIEQVGVSEITLEDVSHFTFSDNGIQVCFNNGPDEFISLRDNDGSGSGDWRGVNLFITRKFLIVDTSK